MASLLGGGGGRTASGPIIKVGRGGRGFPFGGGGGDGPGAPGTAWGLLGRGQIWLPRAALFGVGGSGFGGAFGGPARTFSLFPNTASSCTHPNPSHQGPVPLPPRPPTPQAKKGKQVLAFYTLPEYETWREGLATTAGWDIKYYKAGWGGGFWGWSVAACACRCHADANGVRARARLAVRRREHAHPPRLNPPETPPAHPSHPPPPQGLGTSSAVEAKEYFARLDSHRKQFVWEGEAPGGRAGGSSRRVNGGMR